VSVTRSTVIGPPVAGLNAVASIMAMPRNAALVLENCIAYPDRIDTRFGASDWVTGFANTVRRLFTYSSSTGAESLWATTDAGIYNATTAGAVGAAAIALTDGKCVGVNFSTGANNYLITVNGVDTLKIYDGTSWASVAVLGAVSTVLYSSIEAYRQRLFLVQRNSLQLDYLGANAISGAPTTYSFASIFRRGGKIVSIGTWTIDGGNGPDDQFVIATSMGEIAVFTGNDPATWTLKGVYFIGRPLGANALYKYGGDLLFNSEAGLFPLSKALLTASIDRVQGISSDIRPLFNSAATQFFSNDGWQITAMPDVPLLIVAIPATPNKFQYAMHLETGAWSVWTGWDANCFARMGNTLYWGSATKVAAVGGASDFGSNITATMLGSFNQWNYPKKKHVKLIRPYLTADGAFSYTMGIAQDFNQVPNTNTINGIGGGGSLWGTGLWGTALWTGSGVVTNEWRMVPDLYSTWKAFYLQIVSNSVTVSFLGADIRFMAGSDF
jgi:hypothetical protein